MKQILYIEDNVPTQLVVGKQLAKLGTVSTAASLADGRRLLQERTFDLLISDVFLPDGKALELVREIREKRTAQQFPIIFLSSAMDQLLRAQSLGVGVNDCFPMPSPWPVLLGAVERMLAEPYVHAAQPGMVPVTWVEGKIESRYWIFCPELKLHLEGESLEALREAITARVRQASAGGGKFPYISRVKVMEQLVRLENVASGMPPTSEPASSKPN